MSKSYPIWHQIENCGYKSDKSYGNQNTGNETIFVGSSAKNSHELVKTTVTRRQAYFNDESVIVFRYAVDSVVVKIAIFEDKNGKAGKLLETFSALENVEGLSLSKLTEGVKILD